MSSAKQEQELGSNDQQAELTVATEGQQTISSEELQELEKLVAQGLIHATDDPFIW